MKRICPNCKQAEAGWRYLQCANCREEWQLSDKSTQALTRATYVYVFATFLAGFPIREWFQTVDEVLYFVFPMYGLFFLFYLAAAMIYLSKSATFQPREQGASGD